MSDEPRHEATGTARPTATEYPLTLEDVSRLFDEAGLPRNVRTLQRYCAAGRLDCIKEETATGLAYFVDPVSVERAIKQLAQLHGLTDADAFLYGPRFFGTAASSLVSLIATMSATSEIRSVTSAAIAGVTRNVWLLARSEIDNELRKLGRIARAFGSLRRTGRLDSV
jgi:hypothetical protein